jgi:hypothetical protein
VVQEESIAEHMVKERQRNRRARAKYRFGRNKQATNRVYETDHPFLDRRFAVGDQAKASSLNAEHCGEFSLLVLNGEIARVDPRSGASANGWVQSSSIN